MSADQIAAAWMAPTMSQHNSWWPLGTTGVHIDMPIAEILWAYLLCHSCLIDLSGSACLGDCNTADTQTWENPLISRLLILVLGRTSPEQLVSEQRQFQLSRTPSLCGTKQQESSALLMYLQVPGT